MDVKSKMTHCVKKNIFMEIYPQNVYSNMVKLPDKRAVFFFFERISLGKRERLAIFVLMGLLIILEMFFWLQPYISLSENEYNYASLNQLIDQKAALVKQKHDSLMAHRYYPTEEIIAEIQAPKPKKTTTRKTEKPKLELASIDINTAELADWEKLPRIGPKTAQAILDKRVELGGFSTVEDLLKVKGIGKKTLENLKPYLKPMN
jgi:competence protein ComEA